LSPAAVLRSQLLRLERRSSGQLFVLVDQTLTSQQGSKTENTFSTGNRPRRPRKGRRYGHYKRARKTCHCFVKGLLITPSGIRLPFNGKTMLRQHFRRLVRPIEREWSRRPQEPSAENV
jgi:hypothetical protein